MAIAAGARAAMAGHLAVPAFTGRRDLPATLSRAVLTDLLRGELGFAGLVVSDALDMGGVRGANGGPDVAGALAAGIDLLLCGPDPEAQARRRGSGSGDRPRVSRAAASTDRLEALRAWLAGFAQPPIERVGCAEHRALADELARRSITLVRDRDGLLGRPLAADVRILVVEPRPVDLTPADTSSLLAAGGLAAAIRERHPAVESIVIDEVIDDRSIAAIRGQATRGRSSSSSARSTPLAGRRRPPSPTRSGRPAGH